MAACVALFFAASATVSAENLLSADQNGFETEAADNIGISGWVAGDKYVGFISRSDEQAYEGTYSAKIFVPASDATMTDILFATSGDLGLTSDKTYTLSCYVYIDGANDKLASGMVQLALNDGWATSGGAIQKNTIATGEWVKIEKLGLKGKPSKGAAVKFILQRTVVADLTMYIDNVVLTEEGAAPTAEEIAGFERADAASNVGAFGWESPAGAYLDRVTAMKNSGDASMKAEVAADNASLASVELKNTANTMALEVGDKVKVSCYVYLDGSKKAKLNNFAFALSVGGWIGSTAIPAADITTDGWVKLESPEIEVPEGKAGSYAPYIKLNLTATADELLMYIDDVELTKVETPTSVVSPDASERLFVVKASNGLNIIGAPQGELVEVYNLAGTRIAAEAIASSSHFVAAQSGIYIVKMGEQVTKVIL